MIDDNFLEDKDMYSNTLRLPKAFSIEPEKLLPLRNSCCKLLSMPISEERGPQRNYFWNVGSNWKLSM
jgi:hypothetical protein